MLASKSVTSIRNVFIFNYQFISFFQCVFPREGHSVIIFYFPPALLWFPTQPWCKSLKILFNQGPAEPSRLWMQCHWTLQETNSFIWLSLPIPFPSPPALLLISRAWSVSSSTEVHNYVGPSSILTLQMAPFVGTAVSSWLHWERGRAGISLLTAHLFSGTCCSIH